MISETDTLNRIQGLTARSLRLWVKLGWISPSHDQQGYVFEEIDIARIELIRQLKHDFLVTNDAVPIILSLVDQVHGLRHELRSLAQAVESQHQNTQHAIIAALNDSHGRNND